uniref:tRNA (uracil-O(2)-)-methyltransferase n=3 Tax=Diabrotica virgifera virgifera TaxID=50390 RepID=A0A6P7FEL0_DIAVI
MFPVPLATSSEEIPVSVFWEVVLLYHNRPYLVNKLVTANTKISLYKIDCKGSFGHISELFKLSSILYERRKLKELSKESLNDDFIKSFVECYDKNFKLDKINEETFLDSFSGVYISVQVLISRRSTDHRVLELAIFDKDTNSAIFLTAYENSEDMLTPNFPYEFNWKNGCFGLNLQNFEDADTSKAEWLALTLFPKLLKWSQDDGSKNTIRSLSLVALDEYCVLYERLKRTYVKDLLKDWIDKAKTDPQKYIFEDIAISAYLICLWQNYPKEEINFVDCGCGNGLLVYILNQEGLKGYGIDIRKRAVWDIYPKETRLEVGTVTPDSSFPDATWLIGNHSDELTPWLPVIALKSSRKTNVFVIPCCPYDFGGEKYVRKNTKVSAYAEYLTYIEAIFEKCQFEVDVDKLRIPSTKKVCLVGLTSCSTDEEVVKVLEEVQPFIESKMARTFIARSNVEAVRNCTQLKRELTDRLIFLIVDFLLKEEDLVFKKDGQFWNKGLTYEIADLATIISSEDLKALKLQCGGLQTLMKNFRYIFEVDKGTVRLRQPTTYHVTKEKYRTKPCWFQKNHPQGCFNTAEDCSYKHSVP